jgi:hypothetical protein
MTIWRMHGNSSLLSTDVRKRLSNMVYKASWRRTERCSLLLHNIHKSDGVFRSRNILFLGGSFKSERVSSDFAHFIDKCRGQLLPFILKRRSKNNCRRFL